jgi:prepilin signal peptidase PulO-like enzyme (type II secretory pathway)
MELLNYGVILFILSGLILGSFLCVCIYRMPRKISVVCLGAFCPKCKRSLSWWQNVPIVSFVILKGRCFYCKEPPKLDILREKIKLEIQSQAVSKKEVA